MAHSRAKREIMAKSVKPKQMPERKLEKNTNAQNPFTKKSTNTRGFKY
jgi:hypothetical protein